MSEHDRILAMCSGDLESANIVLELLARPPFERVRLLREGGRPVTGPTPAGATPPAPLTEQPTCSTCLHDLDADGWCDCCGRQEINEARAVRPSKVERREPGNGG